MRFIHIIDQFNIILYDTLMTHAPNMNHSLVQTICMLKYVAHTYTIVTIIIDTLYFSRYVCSQMQRGLQESPFSAAQDRLHTQLAFKPVSHMIYTRTNIEPTRMLTCMIIRTT